MADIKDTNSRLKTLPGFDASFQGGNTSAPFANPANDAQRQANARAYAASQGTDIGSGYLNPETHELQDPDRGFGRAVLSKPQFMMPMILGGALAPGLFAAPAATGAGATGTLASSTIGTGALGPLAGGTAGTSAAASAAGGSNVSFLGSLGKLFGKGGLDPTTLALGGLSLLGGKKQYTPSSFESPGNITDPTQALGHALQMSQRLGDTLARRSPVKLRSSYVQAGPAPVSIPGLPFQIGGGLGRDPALDHPELLQGDDRGIGNPGAGMFDPNQNQQGSPVRRRQP